MKDKLALIIYVASVLATFALCAWLTELIWNSDMPTWLKWMLLR